MNVINNLKKVQAESEETKHNALVTRVLNFFGKDPVVRKRNMFSVWGVVMFATSVFLMDQYGVQLAI